jgi:hypothetical protein
LGQKQREGSFVGIYTLLFWCHVVRQRLWLEPGWDMGPESPSTFHLTTPPISTANCRWVVVWPPLSSGSPSWSRLSGWKRLSCPLKSLLSLSCGSHLNSYSFLVCLF